MSRRIGCRRVMYALFGCASPSFVIQSLTGKRNVQAISPFMRQSGRRRLRVSIYIASTTSWLPCGTKSCVNCSCSGGERELDESNLLRPPNWSHHVEAKCARLSRSEPSMASGMSIFVILALENLQVCRIMSIH
jgi:hypothetical protein